MRLRSLVAALVALVALAALACNGDGPGQLIAQLAGIGAIGVLSFFVGWLTFTLLNLPYTRPWERWGK